MVFDNAKAKISEIRANRDADKGLKKASKERVQYPEEEMTKVRTQISTLDGLLKRGKQDSLYDLTDRGEKSIQTEIKTQDKDRNVTAKNAKAYANDMITAAKTEADRRIKEIKTKLEAAKEEAKKKADEIIEKTDSSKSAKVVVLRELAKTLKEQQAIVVKLTSQLNACSKWFDPNKKSLKNLAVQEQCFDELETIVKSAKDVQAKITSGIDTFNTEISQLEKENISPLTNDLFTNPKIPSNLTNFSKSNLPDELTKIKEKQIPDRFEAPSKSTTQSGGSIFDSEYHTNKDRYLNLVLRQIASDL